MSTSWALLWPLLLGMVLGLAYFGLLWWSLTRLSRWRHPALALLLSLLVRMGLLLATLYFLWGDDWRQLLLALLGIILVRLALTRYLRPQDSLPTTTAASINEGEGRP